MSLIAAIFVLYLLGRTIETVNVFTARFASFMNSGTGMAVTAAVVAYLTFRWYRARHTGDNG